MPPFCYCFWQLQLLRALPLDPGIKIIACASCSSEPETTHVNHSVQNLFSEGGSEKNSRAEGKEVLPYLVLASRQSSARVESRAEGLLVLLG